MATRTNFSNTLDRMGRREICLKSDTAGFDFFGTGHTRALFQSSGNVFVSIEDRKMWETGSARKIAPSFSIDAHSNHQILELVWTLSCLAVDTHQKH